MKTPRKPAEPVPQRGGGRLSLEDEALWEHTARTVQRSKLRASRLPRRPDAGEPGDAAGVSGPAKRKMAMHTAAGVTAPGPEAPARPRRATPPALAEPDRKTARRLGSGRIEIDARLDLHGLTQSAAHGRLRGFLAAAQAEGCRWVLVITGKGGPLGQGSANSRSEHDGGPRGILRRNVPLWLGEPDLRAIVVGFRPAALRHGGDGALYVQLRTRGRG